jgi:hypothetical protein
VFRHARLQQLRLRSRAHPDERHHPSLRQSGRTWPLDSADARATHDDFGVVTRAFEIPTDVKSGWATLVPEHGQPAKVHVC